MSLAPSGLGNPDGRLQKFGHIVVFTVRYKVDRCFTSASVLCIPWNHFAWPHRSALFGSSPSSPQNMAEPDLNINLPPVGTKPPPDQQLAADTGILITGCQSHETSADACPSGNPAKAHGALSNAIQTVVRTHHQQNPGEPLTYRSATGLLHTLSFLALVRHLA